jgi:hypothetical protein
LTCDRELYGAPPRVWIRGRELQLVPCTRCYWGRPVVCASCYWWSDGERRLLLGSDGAAAGHQELEPPQ